MVTAPISGETLSARESEIAAAYVGGASYKEIARNLKISPSTVRAHLRTIYRKLGVSSKVTLGNALGRAPSAPKPVKARIAVLPFTDFGDNPGEEYFTKGVTGDVVTELSRFHQFTVLSSASAVRFFDEPIADRRKNVDYLVEGSMRRAGGCIRIGINLSEAVSGVQLWAERFDGDEGDVFVLQDKIVQCIAATIAGRIQNAITEQARRKPPASLEAYECVLRGAAIGFGDPEAESEAGQFFARAIELDPDYGLAYSELGHIVALSWFREQSDDNSTLDRAFELSKKGATLNPDEPDCLHNLGWIHLHRWQFDLAQRYYERALALNPNSAKQTAYMGDLHSFLGNPDDAFQWYERAQQLDPYFAPSHFWRIQGIAYFCANRLAEAIASFRYSTVIPYWARVYLAACHALIGEDAEARDCAEKILAMAPEFSLNRFAAKEPLRRKEDTARMIEGMRKAGLPE